MHVSRYSYNQQQIEKEKSRKENLVIDHQPIEVPLNYRKPNEWEMNLHRMWQLVQFYGMKKNVPPFKVYKTFPHSKMCAICIPFHSIPCHFICNVLFDLSEQVSMRLMCILSLRIWKLAMCFSVEKIIYAHGNWRRLLHLFWLRFFFAPFIPFYLEKRE